MNGAEIDAFTARAVLFTGKGLSSDDADRMADKLVRRDRDRDADDRRLCLECRHLQGHRPAAWRCGNAVTAGVARLAPELVQTLQRCPGWQAAA